MISYGICANLNRWLHKLLKLLLIVWISCETTYLGDILFALSNWTGYAIRSLILAYMSY